MKTAAKEKDVRGVIPLAEEWKQSCRLWRGLKGDDRVIKLLRGREYRMIYRGSGFLESAPYPHPSPPFSLANCFSFSVFLCVAGRDYWQEIGRGWAWNRIMRPQGSLALYKSFNFLSAHRSPVSSLCSSFTHIRMMTSSVLVVLSFLFQSDQTFKAQPSKLGIWRITLWYGFQVLRFYKIGSMKLMKAPLLRS